MEPLGPTLRRTRRRERPAWRALLAVAVSLALNALVVTQLDASWLGIHPAAVQRDVALAPLDAAEWEANRAIRPRPEGAVPAPPPPAPAPPLDTLRPPGQVVQVDEPARPEDVKAEAPKDARFASDQDRTVKKETRARLVPTDENLPVGGPAAAAAKAGQDGAARQAVVAMAGPKGPGAAGAARADQASPPAQPPGAALGEALRQAAPGPAPGGGADAQALEGKADPRLQLSAATAAKVLGRSLGQGIDQDIEEGDGTFLNTKSWKYATYFNRIRESVGNAWRPLKELDRRDPDRSLYLFKDRLTVLSVTLDEKGALKDVKVVRSSNVDFLDRVAVEAFEQAQPFSNPPAGLVNAQGEIRYVLGFEVYGARPGLHLYRGPAPF